MKLLVIDVNSVHPSPIHKNFLNALPNEMNVKFYGPGYNSEEILNEGLRRFDYLSGGFDIMIVTTHFIESAIFKHRGYPEIAYANQRFEISNFSMISALRYNISILQELENIKNKVKVILFKKDIVSIPSQTQIYIEELMSKNFYLCTTGLDFAMKKHYVKNFGYNKIDLKYKELCRKYYERIIPIPVVAVADSNFVYSDLESREFDWLVAGNISADYPQRGIVQKKLEVNGYNVYNHNKVKGDMIYKQSYRTRLFDLSYHNIKDRIINAMIPGGSFFIPNTFTIAQIAQYREKYLESLRNTKYVYAEGGGTRCIVAKYFEVPAAGALLIGDVADGLDKLGFEPGIHMIEASAKDFPHIANVVMNDKNSIQEIVDNGRKLVVEKHTFRHRAISMRQALELILQEKYKGAYWENGDFILE